MKFATGIDESARKKLMEAPLHLNAAQRERVIKDTDVRLSPMQIAFILTVMQDNLDAQEQHTLNQIVAKIAGGRLEIPWCGLD